MVNYILDADVATTACLSSWESNLLKEYLEKLQRPPNRIWVYLGQFSEILGNLESYPEVREREDPPMVARMLFDKFSKNILICILLKKTENLSLQITLGDP